MENTGLLTGLGAATEFSAGVSFWNRYGRTIYNASVAQLSYNATYDNGTARPNIVLRTTSQARIDNSQINWALGFFGPTFADTPNPTLANWTDPFSVVIIPEGGTENNTLASYDSCFNDYDAVAGALGDLDLYTYLPLYLEQATARFQALAPTGFTFTTNDTYAMQSICSYEYAYIGMSTFCSLFTADEWAGYENTLDIICTSPPHPSTSPSHQPLLKFNTRLLRLRIRQSDRPRPRHRLPARTPRSPAEPIHPFQQFIREFDS